MWTRRPVVKHEAGGPWQCLAKGRPALGNALPRAGPPLAMHCQGRAGSWQCIAKGRPALGNFVDLGAALTTAPHHHTTSQTTTTSAPSIVDGALL